MLAAIAWRLRVNDARTLECCPSHMLLRVSAATDGADAHGPEPAVAAKPCLQTDSVPDTPCTATARCPAVANDAGASCCLLDAAAVSAACVTWLGNMGILLRTFLALALELSTMSEPKMDAAGEQGGCPSSATTAAAETGLHLNSVKRDDSLHA